MNYTEQQFLRRYYLHTTSTSVSKSRKYLVLKFNFFFCFLENMTIFLSSYFLKYFKISLTSNRRFIAIVLSYNFSEHITYRQFLLHVQTSYWKFQFQFFFIENRTIFMGSYLVNCWKLLLTSKRRFIPIILGYNFSKHTT